MSTENAEPISWAEICAGIKRARRSVVDLKQMGIASVQEARCPLCFTLMVKHSLLRHMKTHSNAIDDNTNVPCPKCYSFFRRTDIKKHMQKQHPDTDSSLYDDPGIMTKTFTSEAEQQIEYYFKNNQELVKPEKLKTLAEVMQDNGLLKPSTLELKRSAKNEQGLLKRRRESPKSSDLNKKRRTSV